MRIAFIPQAILALWATSGTCNPDQLPKVSGLTHSGNGCPQDTTVDRAGNFNNLTFAFNSFTTDSSTTSNCAVHFNAVGASPGWQAGLQKVQVTAWQALSPGATVDAYIQAFWSSNADYTRTVKVTASNGGGSTIRGAATVNLDFGDDLLWSPCSGGDGYMGIFNANFRAVSSDGAYFGNSHDVKSTEKFDWVWRTC